ncbi:hypothetical protein BHE74_00006032 [Ensete ventricosum]|nr:hypothetical protein BHE74_00006032 [Ensete ventricosum]
MKPDAPVTHTAFPPTLIVTAALARPVAVLVEKQAKDPSGLLRRPLLCGINRATGRHRITRRPTTSAPSNITHHVTTCDTSGGAWCIA